MAKLKKRGWGVGAKPKLFRSTNRDDSGKGK